MPTYLTLQHIHKIQYLPLSKLILDINSTNFDQPLMNSITDLTLMHNDHLMIKEKNNTCRGLQIACFINGHSHAKDHSLLHKNYTLHIMQNMYVKFFPFFLYKKENSQKDRV